jgi:hypothetical protein
MLASITPLGERSRGFRWALTAAAFAIGAVAAGAAAGGALGALGATVLPDGQSWRGPAVVALLTLTLAFDAGPLPVPTSRRQVNEDWLRRYRGWVYGVGFGAQLGVGVATIVTSATVYAAAALALLAPGAGAGAVIGGVFGALRAASLLPARRVHDPPALARLHRRISALEPRVARAVLAAELLVLIGALA